jgi:hypothetical protein
MTTTHFCLVCFVPIPPLLLQLCTIIACIIILKLITRRTNAYESISEHVRFYASRRGSCQLLFSIYVNGWGRSPTSQSGTLGSSSWSPKLARTLLILTLTGYDTEQRSQRWSEPPRRGVVGGALVMIHDCHGVTHLLVGNIFPLRQVTHTLGPAESLDGRPFCSPKCAKTHGKPQLRHFEITPTGAAEVWGPRFNCGLPITSSVRSHYYHVTPTNFFRVSAIPPPVGQVQ